MQFSTVKFLFFLFLVVFHSTNIFIFCFEIRIRDSVPANGQLLLGPFPLSTLVSSIEECINENLIIVVDITQSGSLQLRASLNRLPNRQDNVWTLNQQIDSAQIALWELPAHSCTNDSYVNIIMFNDRNDTIVNVNGTIYATALHKMKFDEMKHIDLVFGHYIFLALSIPNQFDVDISKFHCNLRLECSSADKIATFSTKIFVAPWRYPTSLRSSAFNRIVPLQWKNVNVSTFVALWTPQDLTQTQYLSFLLTSRDGNLTQPFPVLISFTFYEERFLYVLQSQGTEVVVPDVHLNAGDWVYFNGVYLGENEILTISTNSTLLPIIEENDYPRSDSGSVDFDQQNVNKHRSPENGEIITRTFSVFKPKRTSNYFVAFHNAQSVSLQTAITFNIAIEEELKFNQNRTGTLLNKGNWRYFYFYVPSNIIEIVIHFRSFGFEVIRLFAGIGNRPNENDYVDWTSVVLTRVALEYHLIIPKRSTNNERYWIGVKNTIARAFTFELMLEARNAPTPPPPLSVPTINYPSSSDTNQTSPMTPTSNTGPSSFRLIGGIVVIATLVGIAGFVSVYVLCFRKKPLKETDTHSYVMLSQDNKQT